MQPLTAHTLLDIWEWGQGQTPVARALALLAAAYPGTPREDLERLTIGQRDARLLALRELTFGSRIDCLVSCPACGEALDLALSTTDLQASQPDAPAGEAAHTLDVAGYWLAFRLPSSVDLAQVAAAGDPAPGKQQLLESCLVQVLRSVNGSPGGESEKEAGDQVSVPAAELPADVVAALQARMAELDPLAGVSLALDCPACGHAWPAPFDIVSFFWQEIEAWALRMLGQVHSLASAYGWREADVLALSPARRQIYLNWIGV